MGSDRRHEWLLPRTLFMHVVAVGSLLLLLTALAQPLAPSARASAPHDEESPEAFLQRAYSQRARAMTLGDSTLLDGLYDPASAELLKYERERVAYFQDGFWASQEGKVIVYWSEIRMEETAGTGSLFKARLNEWLSIVWLPRAKELPTWTEQVRRQEPQAWRMSGSLGPHGEYVSGMGTPHEVTIVRGSGGWRIARDFYREPERGDAALSPGTVVGSWAAPEWTGGPIPGHVYLPILPLAGSAETPFPFVAAIGAILLGLGLVVRGAGGGHRLRSK